MNNIQLDMFEVQLGAAILVQFRNEGEVIRVLADAGILASDYPLDHVHKKLPEAIKYFDADSKNFRLDLIVGTHYDADHLEGLVPIIEDSTIDIGEAWMPPVANDSETHAVNESVQDSQLLGYQFIQENGIEALLKYLRYKQAVCEELKELESEADKFREDSYQKEFRQQQEFIKYEELYLNHSSPEFQTSRLDSFSKYFKKHLDHSNLSLNITDYCHADDEFNYESEKYFNSLKSLTKGRFHWWRLNVFGNNAQQRKKYFIDRWQNTSDLVEPDTFSMAFIRRAAAKDAINAASLYKVVNALNKRHVPISWHMIPDGTPRRFIWEDKNQRFTPSKQKTSTGPEILLFGPSEGLVRKHRTRLPIGSYFAYIANRAIPIKNITPSNQLSYVFRFGFKDQGILISGDAGFVDSKPQKKNNYYKEIINQLMPLQVVQVAHHGGNNAHFYRVLLEANYATQKSPSLLLLSHATHDKYRPSKEFGMFIENVRKDGDDVKLLFTSEPDVSKVKDYKELIYPIAGVSAKLPVGDVRIVYYMKEWKVEKHAIQI